MLVVLVAMALCACAGSLRLTASGSFVRKPANVVVLFRVDGPQGPIAGLGPDAFRVTEDGFEVPAGPDLDLSRPDLSAILRLLVLLDFGGHPSETERDAMIEVAGTLVRRLASTARVAVYVFDGAARPEVVVMASQARDADEPLAKLRTRAPRDASTDLNGALLTAIKTLQLQSDDPKPLAGMLVLVSRGPDRAARVSSGEVTDQLDSTDMAISRFVLRLGPLALPVDYDWIATEPPVVLADPAGAEQTAGAVADRMLGLAQSYYLLSYCSGARSGRHAVKIAASRTVTLPNGERESQTGTLTLPFPADGFGPGCTPWKAPSPEATPSTTPKKTLFSARARHPWS
jgi:hypothetical protein